MFAEVQGLTSGASFQPEPFLELLLLPLVRIDSKPDLKACSFSKFLQQGFCCDSGRLYSAIGWKRDEHRTSVRSLKPGWPNPEVPFLCAQLCAECFFNREPGAKRHRAIGVLNQRFCL